MNRVQIKRLEFSNMLSYGEGMAIEFDSKVTQLVGKNGAGKSSIPTILEDLFYNKNSRGLKKAGLKNRYITANFYSSACDFSVGEINYRLEKRTTSTTTLKLYKEGLDISGHTATQTYEIVQNILGMDFPTFTKLVYQSILSNLDFLRATDANRKKFLVSLLGLEKYSVILERIKKVVSDTKADLAAVKGSISAVLPIASKVPKQEQELLPDPQYSVEEDKQLLIKYREELTEINLKNSKIEQNNKLRARVQSIAIPAEPTKPNFDIEKVNSEVRRLEALKTSLNSELRTLKAPATKCPTCGTPYNNEDHVKHIESRIEAIKQEWAAAKPLLDDFTAKAAEYKTYETKYKTYENSKNQAQILWDSVDSELPATTTDTYKLEAKILDLHQYINKIEKEIAEVSKKNQAIQISNAGIEAENLQISEFRQKLAQLQEEQKELEEVMDKLDVLNKVFGPKGLIAFKIESMTKIFEELLNQYLTVFTDGRFNLVFQIEDTKLALKVYDYGEEIDIVSVSSGEYNRINTATLLAIRKMMTSIAKADINVLFLDEVISVLDKEGKDTLIDVLLQEDYLNTIVVSHGYTHPLATKISVIKQNNISRLEREDV